MFLAGWRRPMTISSGEARRTPLYEAHVQLGARLIDFGGWQMPVSYKAGIIEEHHATRKAVGVFDVSHMGEIHFRGPRALEAVQHLVTNDVSKLEDGRALYTVACLPSGGIVDDLIVYRLGAQHFLLVVNASNIAKDFEWFKRNVGTWCDVQDASDDTALISYQGPQAKATLGALTKFPVASLKSFHFATDVEVAGVRTSIARTGYTGEDGFELFCPPNDAPRLWGALIEAADRVGGKPVGLGARDTLRLEARLSLYGQDLSEDVTPLEAGLGWVVKLDSGNFIGKDALLQQKGNVRRKLAGMVMLGRGIARHGYPIHAAGQGESGAKPGEQIGDKPGERIGEVTSGTVGPTIQKNIALGYVSSEKAEPGTRLLVDCRGKMTEAEVVKGPFYKRSN
jgi:aminomethyltransferase